MAPDTITPSISSQFLTLLEIVTILLGGASLVFAVRGHMRRLTDALVDLREAVKGLSGRLDRYDQRLGRHHDRLQRLEWNAGVKAHSNDDDG